LVCYTVPFYIIVYTKEVRKFSFYENYNLNFKRSIKEYWNFKKMRIVVLQGLIGSGKDSTARYLLQKYGGVKMSFASTLKDVVSVLFDWDRNLLEGDTEESREWRETIDEWWSR
jgi:hypothetical protein